MKHPRKRRALSWGEKPIEPEPRPENWKVPKQPTKTTKWNGDFVAGHEDYSDTKIREYFKKAGR